MNAVRITLIVLDAFVALTAIGGGIALATGLEGQRYPVEWLRHTPFRSYVIPGLILATVGLVENNHQLRRPILAAAASPTSTTRNTG